MQKIVLLAAAICAYASFTVSQSIVDTAPLQLQYASAASNDDDADDEEEEEDEEQCPAGFEESENKCTAEEREDGCKDIRLDNGKGCVSR
jgi:hypothetical protein